AGRDATWRHYTYAQGDRAGRRTRIARVTALAAGDRGASVLRADGGDAGGIHAVAVPAVHQSAEAGAWPVEAAGRSGAGAGPGREGGGEVPGGVNKSAKHTTNNTNQTNQHE